MSDTKGLINKLCTIQGRLDKKLAIVTGANSGIGLHTAGELARRGAQVIMACRNMERAYAARDKLMSSYGVANPHWMKTDIADPSVTSSLTPIKEEQLTIEELDLASRNSIRQFAQRVQRVYPEVHFLINNAAVALDEYKTTQDGLEMTMAVNHLGHFLLTELFMPALRAAAPSRVINVSSVAHYDGHLTRPNLQIPEQEYSLSSAYSASKLANVMHAVELNKRLEGTGVMAVSIHPGIVATNLIRNPKTLNTKIVSSLIRPFSISPWAGAQTTLYTVLTDKLVPGGYYSNCALKAPNSLANDGEERKWLWKKSCELVGLANNKT